MRFAVSPTLSTTGGRGACCRGAGVVVGAGLAVGSNGAGVDVGLASAPAAGAASEPVDWTGVTVSRGSGVDVATSAVEELQAIAAIAKRASAVQVTPRTKFQSPRALRNCRSPIATIFSSAFADGSYRRSLQAVITRYHSDGPKGSSIFGSVRVIQADVERRR